MQAQLVSYRVSVLMSGRLIPAATYSQDSRSLMYYTLKPPYKVSIMCDSNVGGWMSVQEMLRHDKTCLVGVDAYHDTLKIH